MKAAIYYGQKDVRLEEFETPVVGVNDIVVKSLYASICGTDVAVYTLGPNTGHRITVGSEFVHKMISEVVQVGENVKDIEAGMIVNPYPRLAKGDPRRAGMAGGFPEYIPPRRSGHLLRRHIRRIRLQSHRNWTYFLF